MGIEQFFSSNFFFIFLSLFLCLRVHIKLYNLNNICIILDCEKLIRHMLVVEPERRLSISQILAHSWMDEDGIIELEPGGYVM